MIDELSAIAARRSAEPPVPGSIRPLIRPATAEDRAAVVEMAARCSRDTLRRRFHGPVGDGHPARVAELLEGGVRQRVEHLVADAGGAIVGTASLHRKGRSEGEMAVLVEDAWQGTGVGRRLTAHLIRRAHDRGLTAIVADVMRDPAFVLDQLRRAVAGTCVDFDGAIATVRIPLTSATELPPATGALPPVTA